MQNVWLTTSAPNGFKGKGSVTLAGLWKTVNCDSGYIIYKKKNNFEVWTWSVMILLNPYKTVILHTRESHMASCLALARQKGDSYCFCWFNQTGLSRVNQQFFTNHQTQINNLTQNFTLMDQHIHDFGCYFVQTDNRKDATLTISIKTKDILNIFK